MTARDVSAVAPAPAVPLIDFPLARSMIADVRMGRSTWTRVAPALGIAPGDLPADREGRALAVYRAYVGGVVDAASPLLSRACALNGLDPDELAIRLRPAVYWDHWLCGVPPDYAWLQSLVGQVDARDATPAMRREWAVQEWLHCGAIDFDSTARLTMLGVRVLDRGLEMAASIGGNRLRTHGGEGSITLAFDVPATMSVALPGVALDRFIDHPLIAGAGCVVTGVDERTMWGTRVRFALPTVPWRLPWAR